MTLDLVTQCRAVKLPEPEREFYFAKPRRFRFDFCWPAEKIALEVQGGLFLPNGGGRHNRGAALLNEHTKLNLAAALGWRVLFTTPTDVANGKAIMLLESVLRTSS